MYRSSRLSTSERDVDVFRSVASASSKSSASLLKFIATLSIVLAAFLVEASNVRAQFVGPVFPPPGFQGSVTQTGDPGRTGGRTFTYPSINLGQTRALYYGVPLSGAQLSLSNDGFQPGETLVYNSGASNLAGGVVVFSGSSFFCGGSNCGSGTFGVSLRVFITKLDGTTPIPLTTNSPVQGYAGQPLLVVPNSGFKVNFTLLVNSTTPYLDFVDGCSTFCPPASRSVNFGFWHLHASRASNFDSDFLADISLWNPNNTNWYFIDSTTNQFRIHNDWGAGFLGDVAVPRDYDGDGKTDMAVWRAPEGNWYIVNSSNNSITVKGWGAGNLNDVPVAEDYDSDGRADLAVWRSSEGNWYIINSATNTITIKGWGSGSLGDLPVTGDYDRDGRADIAVWRPSEGNWYILNSLTNTVTVRGWGASSLGDQPVQADYDGDGKTDIAVWRGSEGNWYILNSSDNSVTVRGWGSSGLGDEPVPADYDGDGRADIAVWRPSEGNWYILNSSNNSVSMVNLGESGAVPVPSTYLPQ